MGRSSATAPSRASGRPTSPKPGVDVAIVGWRLGDELADALRAGAERRRYAVVSMSLPDDLRPRVEWHRIPRLRWNSYRLRWLVFFVLAGIRVARLRPRAIHCVGPTPVIPNRVDLSTVTFCHAAFAEATAGRPVKGSSSAVGWRLGQRFALALERWWFGRVRMLGALSEDGAEDLRRQYPDATVVLTPRGLDIERLRPDPETRRALRVEEGIPDSAVAALFVDQEHRPLKGLDLAIEGFAAAVSGPDLLLVLGAGNEACSDLAARLGVADRVRFMGYRVDVDRVYKAADLFLLPTAYETFCRAAHEAAACGLPVVAPPVSGIRGLVGRNEAGVLVRREAADVARALDRLAPDPVLRSRMGAVARERASSCDREAAAIRVDRLHLSLLARNGT